MTRGQGDAGAAGTLTRLTEHAGRRFGARTAFTFPGVDDLAFAALAELTARFAAGLAIAGIGAGDRVALHLPNGRNWIVAYHAIARAGAVVVPCNILCSLHEVAFAVIDSGALLIVAPDDRAADLAALITARVVTPTDFPALVAHPPAAAVARAPEDLFTIAYTSGTTGTPKGVMLSHANVHASMTATAICHVRRASDVVLSALPFPHVYGNIVMNAVLLTGMRMVALPRFEAGEVIDLIAREQVTLFEGVPTMYYQLLAHPDINAANLTSLRRCTVGGQTMPLAKLEAVVARFGCPLLELWGMTELSGPAVTHSPDWPARLGTVGLPLPGVELRIATPDAAASAPPVGQAGEVLIRGPMVMRGYWNRPEASAAAVDAEGWFATGDIGAIDDAGYLTIIDRKKDLIITAGYNVYPAEIEQALATHPAVEMVAVAGFPDAEKGELAHAFVVCRRGLSTSEAELIAYSRERLAAYKRPRVIHFVDELPRTSSGKLLRRALAALLPKPE